MKTLDSMKRQKVSKTTIERPKYLQLQIEIAAALMIRSQAFTAPEIAKQARVIVDAVLEENLTTLRVPDVKKEPVKRSRKPKRHSHHKGIRG